MTSILVIGAAVRIPAADWGENHIAKEAPL
jgi:hypothetical protein